MVALIILFSSLLAHAETAPQTTKPSSQQLFLQLQTETVNVLDQINVAHLRGIKECACYEEFKSSGRVSKNCGSNNYVSEPTFIKQIINFYGETVRSQMNCSAVMNVYVFGPLSRQIPMMRQRMILMKPDEEIYNAMENQRSETRQAPWFYQDATLPGNLRNLVSTELKHEIAELPWKRNLSNSTPKPIERAELQQALATYFKSSHDKCVELLPVYLNKFGPGFSWTLGTSLDEFQNANPDGLCTELIEGTGTQFGSVSHLRSSFEGLLVWLFKWRAGEFRVGERAQYVRMIQNNPLLVAFNTATPSFDELIEALTVMEANAKERLHDSAVGVHSGGLLSAVAMTQAQAYTAARWRGMGLSDEDFNLYVRQSTEQLAHQTMLWNIAQGTASIGLLTACAVPWGKSLKVGLLLMRSSCLALVGIPLNSYFLYGSIAEYDLAFRHFFSTLDAPKALPDTVDAQNSAEAWSMINAATMPVAMGLVQAKESVLILRKLLRPSAAPALAKIAPR